MSYTIIVNVVSQWDQSVTPCYVEFTEYQHGEGVAIQLYSVEDGEPYARVSVNIEGVVLGKNEFIFKDTAENEGMLEAFLNAGIVKTTDRTATSGYNTYPIVEILKYR